MEGPVNIYASRLAPPPLDFPHHLHGRRDRSDPEFPPHLRDFARFIRLNNPALRSRGFHLESLVQRAQHNISLEVEDADVPAFHAWLARADAVYFLPDVTIRDPQGKVLWSPETPDGEDGTAVPYPREALDRRQRSNDRLAALELHPSPGLPPVIGEPELTLRPAREVAERLMALTTIALAGELLGGGHPMPLRLAQAEIRPDRGWFTPREKHFLNEGARKSLIGKLLGGAPKYTHEEVVAASWRYEAAQLLFWALGLADDLPFPSGQSDVKPLLQATTSPSRKRIVTGAALRPAAEILDALDLHYRLHWLAVEESLGRLTPAVKIDGGVVQERHLALNWLVDPATPWDAVETPT